VDPTHIDVTTNKKRLQAAMEAEGIEFIVGARPSNAFYLTDFIPLFHWANRDPSAVLSMLIGVMDGDGKTTLITPPNNVDRIATSHPPVDRVVVLGTLTQAIGDAQRHNRSDAFLTALISESRRNPLSLIDAFQSADIGEGTRIGVDDPTLGHILQDSLGATFVEGDQILRQARAVKTSAELNRLKQASDITESAMLRSMEAVREGVTERELAEVYECEVVRQGAKTYLTVVSTGHASAYGTHEPGDQRVARGDLIRWDVSADVAGYVSDIGRIAVLGKPTSEQSKKFEATRIGLERALEAMRPGVPCRDIYEVGMKAARQAGLDELERGFIGHGIGINVYESPAVTAETEEILEVGNVLAVEIPYYELGFGGAIVEDTVVVTDDGVEVLSRFPRTLIEV
jgi:Xaa-Pro dipeptidase